MVTADCSSRSLLMSCHIGSSSFELHDFSIHTPSSLAAVDVSDDSFGSGGIPFMIAVSSTCFVGNNVLSLG